MGNYTIQEKLDATHFLGLAEVIGSINNSEVVLHANKYNLATTNLQFKCSFPQ